jgi:tetratricopeptide (TPR) repeat protein
MKKADYPAAVIQFLNALECDNRSVETLQRLAEAYIGNRQPGKAEDVLARAVNIDPNLLDIRLMLGRLHLAAGDAQGAGEQASFVIGRDPANASAHRMLGAALMSRKEPEKARQAFERAAELAPGDASSLVNLGMILAVQGKRVEAERRLRKAIDVDPRYLAGYSVLADFYRRLGKLAEAGKVFESGIGQNPEAAGLYLSAADLLLAQGESEAFEALLKRLRERVRKPATALALGDFFASRNQRARAIREYRFGLEIDPKHLQLMARLVEQHLAAGEAKEPGAGTRQS